MTRRTPGHERAPAEDSQLRRLSATRAAALVAPADDMLTLMDPAPARLGALRSVTALRDRSSDTDSDTGNDTPDPNHQISDVPDRDEADNGVRLALLPDHLGLIDAEVSGPGVIGPGVIAPGGIRTDRSREIGADEVVAFADGRAAPSGSGPADSSAADSSAAVSVATLWPHRGGPRDRAVRDLLVRHYGPLVRAVAARMAAGLPASVESADLAQAGVFGLLDAIARFEPSRGVRFESYAAQRIRGAMLDELRAQDWVPRSVRSRIREIERARERLEVVLGRSPDRREIAVELGIPLRDLLRVAHHRRLVSVEALAETTTSTVESVVDEAAPDPAAAFDLRETYRELVEAISRLDERDRLVVQLYYVENRTLAEIGTLLGVTESRVCQLHSRMVVRLRGQLAEPVAG